MICPQCGAEYRPGFTQCSDCLIDLVEQPVDAAESPPEGVQGAAQAQPQTPPSGHADLVTVFRCGDPDGPRWPSRSCNRLRYRSWF